MSPGERWRLRVGGHLHHKVRVTVRQRQRGTWPSPFSVAFLAFKRLSRILFAARTMHPHADTSTCACTCTCTCTCGKPNDPRITRACFQIVPLLSQITRACFQIVPRLLQRTNASISVKLVPPSPPPILSSFCLLLSSLVSSIQVLAHVPGVANLTNLQIFFSCLLLSKPRTLPTLTFNRSCLVLS